MDEQDLRRALQVIEESSLRAISDGAHFNALERIRKIASDALRGADTIVEDRLRFKRWQNTHPAGTSKRFRSQGGRCYWCGTPLWAERPSWLDGQVGAQIIPTWDHLVPIASGGDPIRLGNLVVACDYCNRQRGANIHWRPRARGPFGETLDLLRKWPHDEVIRCMCGKTYAKASEFHRHRRKTGHRPIRLKT